MSFLRAIIGLHPRRLGIATLFLVLGTLTEGLSLLLFLPVIHLVSEGRDVVDLTGLPLPQGFPDSAPLSMLLLAIICLTGGLVLFGRLKGVYLARLVYDFSDRLRLGLFSDVAAADWSQVIRIPRSRLEHALTEDIDRVHVAAYSLLNILQSVVGLVIYLGLGLMISPLMTLLCLAIGGLALTLLRPYRRAATAYGASLQSQRLRLSQTIKEFTRAMKLARSMNLEPRYQSLLGEMLRQTRDGSLSYVRKSLVGSGLFQLAAATGAALFIWVARSWAQMDLARIAVLLLLFLRAVPRFSGVQASLQQILVDLPAWDAVRRLQAELSCSRDPDPSVEEPAARPLSEISLCNVTWRFPDAPRDTLDRMSLTMRAGQITVLTGPSGAGKSTVADIVMGLIRPQHGKVLVDGVPLAASQLRSWRDRAAYITQDPLLMNASIRANLALAMPGSDPEAEETMQRALRAAAADFVSRLPGGLDHGVGDQGGLLSGGERQRIAFARGLMRNPDLLVLDEATSALDLQNEESLVRTVQSLRGKTTILVITHRPALVAIADAVYVMENGRAIGKSPDGPRREAQISPAVSIT
ncbi:ABC transporter ATP-binding protein [Paracoccus ravus]|uniref:ABC transporter ATP-binding protein n=1 Tax=Paracoccus ravus TaxID=2447760 RepID=UPI001ADC7802|nr:ABC transporter ATP-binding protein [Paracoccus ravus]